LLRALEEWRTRARNPSTPPFTTFDEHFDMFLDDRDKEKFPFVGEASVEQCIWAGFYKVITRDWRFDTRVSKEFGDVTGPFKYLHKGS
jgi:hypothetical protein